MVNRPIEFYHDYKAWLLPAINSKLKNYQLPHCFKISLVHGIAVCVHKPYSSSPEWLPPAPATRVSQEEMPTQSTNFSVSEYDLYGGSDIIFDRVIYEGRTLSERDLMFNSNYEAIAERGEMFRQIRDRLTDLNIDTVCESISQMEVEAEQGYRYQFNPIVIRDAENDNAIQPSENTASVAANDADDNIELEDIVDDDSVIRMSRQEVDVEQRKAMYKYMQSQATSREGYVFWLDYSKLVDLDAWQQSVPKPIHYYNEVSNLTSSVNCFDCPEFVFVSILYRLK